MKYKIFTLGFFAATTAIVSLSSFKPERVSLEKGFHVYQNGAPAAKTGAPSEGTCTDCHGGSILDGSNVNTITLASGAELMPETTTTVTLDFSDGGSKNGFQLTVLDENNNFAGTLVSTDAGTQTSTGNGRTYIGQTTAGTPNSTWNFEWTAPSAATQTVTFYVATNNSNANGQNSGDLIYNSQHVFSQAGAGLFTEVKQESFFELGYAANDNLIVLDYTAEKQEKAVLTILNMQGQTILLENLGEVFVGENTTKVALPAGLEQGVYVAHFFIGNKGGSKKFFVK